MKAQLVAELEARVEMGRLGGGHLRPRDVVAAADESERGAERVQQVLACVVAIFGERLVERREVEATCAHLERKPDAARGFSVEQSVQGGLGGIDVGLRGLDVRNEDAL